MTTTTAFQTVDCQHNFLGAALCWEISMGPKIWQTGVLVVCWGYMSLIPELVLLETAV